MDPIRTAAGAALTAAALGAAALAQPPPLAWPEAIARLAAERTRANTCVEQARTLGVAATDPLARGYGEAKAEVDGVIAGLAVTLAEQREPAALAELERRMAAGVETEAPPTIKPPTHPPAARHRLPPLIGDPPLDLADGDIGAERGAGFGFGHGGIVGAEVLPAQR